MKTRMKALTLVLCAVLLVCASVMGTLAYLKSQTGPVTNTFTVGKVNITLDEAAVDLYGQKIDTNSDSTIDASDRRVENEYKLIPGHTYVKDPTIHVTAESEACFVFVKVENGLKDIVTDTTIEAQIANKGWTQLYDAAGKAVEGVYYKALDQETAYDGEELVVFENFKLLDDADVAKFASAKIIITGYAIQADGFGTDAYAAWEAGNFQ